MRLIIIEWTHTTFVQQCSTLISSIVCGKQRSSNCGTELQQRGDSMSEHKHDDDAASSSSHYSPSTKRLLTAGCEPDRKIWVGGGGGGDTKGAARCCFGTVRFFLDSCSDFIDAVLATTPMAERECRACSTFPTCLRPCVGNR